MTLETMRPTPTWDAASYEETVETLASHADDVRFIVWGGDWCKDCRALLPDFGAALDAAGVPDERIDEIAVDAEKRGRGVEEYDVEYIPTIVVERAPPGADGSDREELCRFVESENVPPAVWIASQLE